MALMQRRLLFPGGERSAAFAEAHGHLGRNEDFFLKNHLAESRKKYSHSNLFTGTG